VVETDLHGYYDKKLLNYYPDPLEWQFRDEYPMDDSVNYVMDMSPNEWNSVDENFSFNSDSKVKTPEEFQQEVEMLRAKYKLESPNLWEREQTSAKH
jgi:hypothetical protein